jgi:hypothetical protein
MTQKATLPSKMESNAKNLDGDKNRIKTFKAITKTQTGKWVELVDLRTWKSFNADGAAPEYATVWIRKPDFYTSGHGRATGYGYHKTSAAAYRAFESAGIKLSEDIDGRGDSAIRDAITAICEALGFNDIYIVE